MAHEDKNMTEEDSAVPLAWVSAFGLPKQNTDAEVRESVDRRLRWWGTRVGLPTFGALIALVVWIWGTVPDKVAEAASARLKLDSLEQLVREAHTKVGITEGQRLSVQKQLEDAAAQLATVNGAVAAANAKLGEVNEQLRAAENLAKQATPEGQQNALKVVQALHQAMNAAGPRAENALGAVVNFWKSPPIELEVRTFVVDEVVGKTERAEIVARCDPGFTLIGGGFHCDHSNMTVFESQPHPDKNWWTVKFDNRDQNMHCGVKVFAIGYRLNLTKPTTLPTSASSHGR